MELKIEFEYKILSKLSSFGDRIQIINHLIFAKRKAISYNFSRFKSFRSYSHGKWSQKKKMEPYQTGKSKRICQCIKTWSHTEITLTFQFIFHLKKKCFTSSKCKMIHKISRCNNKMPTSFKPLQLPTTKFSFCFWFQKSELLTTPTKPGQMIINGSQFLLGIGLQWKQSPSFRGDPKRKFTVQEHVKEFKNKWESKFLKMQNRRNQ